MLGLLLDPPLSCIYFQSSQKFRYRLNMFGSRLAINYRLSVAADSNHDSLSEFTTLEYRYQIIASTREQTLCTSIAQMHLFAMTIDVLSMKHWRVITALISLQ